MLPIDELPYKIAFASYRNMNIGVAERFAQLHVSLSDFFGLPARDLAHIAGVRESYFDDNLRAVTLEAARKEADFIETNGIKAIFHSDAAYPRRLASCNDAPAMLYVFGDKGIEAPHIVGIVGTRHCTAYGADFTRHFVEELAARLDGLLIVSGLAYGIDITAHRAALACGIPTGAILAHGLNTIYPAEHRNEARRMCAEGGFLATEYTGNAAIHRGNFLARNRIVAGMVDALVVVESNLKGGAMTTARMAAAYDREVFALPGRVSDTYSRGCNSLVANDTAHLLRDADDLISIMGWFAKAPTGTQADLPFVNEQQAKVLEFLTGHPEATVNDICVGLGMPFARLSAMLFEMELNDLVTALPGGRYGVINYCK